MNEPIIGEAKRRGRRRILLSGAAGAVSLLCAKPVFAATFEKWLGDRAIEPLPGAVTSELFAYPTRAGRSTVIAAIWREPLFIDGLASTSEITLHSGLHRWTGVVETSPRVVYAPDFEHHAFIGDIARERATSAGRLVGIFIEAPTDALAGGKALQVWAERRLLDGSRRRIGSPLLAPLINAHAALSKAYHTLDPQADRDVLLPDLQEVIASKARQGAADPRARLLANRLANELLPDVLHYDPSQPCGFTFAARNGRFPSDHCDAVVRSVLSRSVSA